MLYVIARKGNILKRKNYSDFLDMKYQLKKKFLKHFLNKKFVNYTLRQKLKKLWDIYF